MQAGNFFLGFVRVEHDKRVKFILCLHCKYWFDFMNEFFVVLVSVDLQSLIVVSTLLLSL